MSSLITTIFRGLWFVAFFSVVVFLVGMLMFSMAALSIALNTP